MRAPGRLSRLVSKELPSFLAQFLLLQNLQQIFQLVGPVVVAAAQASDCLVARPRSVLLHRFQLQGGIQHGALWVVRQYP